MLGGRTEYAFAPNWAAKLECNYIDLGSETTNAFICRFSERGDQRAHLVMGWLNFRFPPR